MKIKDLDSSINLRNIKIKIPEEHKTKCIICGLDTMEVYIYSKWNLGIWVKKNKEDSRIYPLTPIDISQCLEWEVVDDGIHE